MTKAPVAFSIRDAREGDAPALVQFNVALARESEGLTLDPATLRAGVTRALATPTLCRYFVAAAAGGLIGQTMLTYELSDWRDGLVYWIQSVYVEPAARGQGVFRALYDHVVDVARRAGDARAVRLYVDKANAAGIGVYERLGMRRAHYHIYEAGL